MFCCQNEERDGISLGPAGDWPGEWSSVSVQHALGARCPSPLPTTCEGIGRCGGEGRPRTYSPNVSHGSNLTDSTFCFASMIEWGKCDHSMFGVIWKYLGQHYACLFIWLYYDWCMYQPKGQIVGKAGWTLPQCRWVEMKHFVGWIFCLQCER